MSERAGAPPQRGLSRTGLFAAALVGCCSFMDVYSTQPILPLLEHLFGATKAEAGLTVSATTAAVALFASIVGAFADRASRKRVIVASLFALSVPTFLAATSRGLGDLVLWRFVQGAIVPGVYVLVLAYITEEARPASLGMAMAAFIVGTVVGGLGGRVLTGVISDHAGWRAAFVVLGVINVAGALATWWLLPPSQHFTPRRRTGPAGRERRTALRDPRLLATYAVGFNVLFALVVAFTYVAFYLTAPPFGLGTSAVSMVFLVYIVGAFVTMSVGRVIDRAGSRVVLVGAAVGGAAGILLTLIPTLPAVILGLTICCSAAFVSQSAAASYLRVAAPPAVRALASGVYVTVYYVGGSVGGVLPGLLWSRAGWAGSVGLVICSQLAAATIAWRGWRGARVPA